jgi:phosphate transport system substrate-binding protein
MVFYRLTHVALAITVAILSSATFATADVIKVGGTGGALAYLERIAELVDDTFEIDVVDGLGSSGANRAVIAGVIDVAISGRALNDNERAAGLIARPLLTTPFAFFTSHEDPVDIPSAQIWQLYQNPGSPNALFDDEPVRVILRPESDSDQAFAKAHFEGFEAAYEAARSIHGVPLAQTDQDNADLAEQLDNSLTTGTLLQMVSEERNLRAISIDGIAPTPETLRSRTYPYVKTFYVVFRPDAAEDVTAFVDYLFSPAGVANAEALGAIVVGP